MDDKRTAESFGYKQELNRVLTFKDLIFYGLVFMSPISCMIFFGLLSTVSEGHAVLAYAIAFVAVAFTAVSYGEMAQAFPLAGSTYSYTQRSIDPRAGFVAGWLVLLDYFALPMIVNLTSASYAHQFFPQIPVWVWAIIFIGFCTFVNYRGIEMTSKADNFMMFITIALIVVFLVFAIRYVAIGEAELSVTYIYNPQTFALPAVVAAAAIAIVNFLGFDGITTLSEEAKDGGKKIALAIIVACAIQATVFIIVTFFATAANPDWTTIGDPEIGFYNVAYKLGGTFLQIFAPTVFIVAGIGTCLATQSAASRVLFGMGRDKVIWKKFAYVHPKYKSPIFGILVMAILFVLGTIFLQYGLIAEMISFGGLCGFICVNLSVFVFYFLKKRGDNFSVIKHVIFPILGMAVSAYLIAGLDTLSKIVGFSWMAVAIIYVVVRSNTSQEFRENLDQVRYSEKKE